MNISISSCANILSNHTNETWNSQLIQFISQNGGMVCCMSSVAREFGWLDCFYKDYASTRKLILRDLKEPDAGKVPWDVTAPRPSMQHLRIADRVSDQLFC